MKVTEATRDDIVAHFRAQAAELGADEDEVVSGIDQLPAADGLVDLGWSYTTFEIED